MGFPRPRKVKNHRTMAFRGLGKQKIIGRWHFRGLGKRKSCVNYKKQLFLNKILMKMKKTIVSKQNP